MSSHQTRDTLSPRSLEVTTDAPLPPTLAIISPTPRTFTFPATVPIHHDSPFSSPSQSPFEPEAHPFIPSPSSISPPSSLFRTLSPANLSPTDAFPPTNFPPPPASTTILNAPLKRRKSSCASIDMERRPKKGDDDYVKRPENAFILFRRKCCEERQAAQAAATTSAEGSSTGAATVAAKKQRQADLSKTISQQWKSLSAEERQHWEELAKEKKKEHEAMHPGYVYRPQRSAKKDSEGRSKSKTRKPKGIRGDYEHQEADEISSEQRPDSLTFVLPTHAASAAAHAAAAFSRRHGRSASAPTPQPYQAIQVPNVYMGSCPTSPSLLPLISQQRAGHPDHSGGAMCFDYLPAPTFVQTGAYEASLQSSDFFQNMFNMPPPQHQPQHPHHHHHQRPIPSPLSMVANYHTTSPNPLMPSLISPADSTGSRSSSPSSSHSSSGPNSGPFTPTTAASMLATSFSQLGYADANATTPTGTNPGVLIAPAVQFGGEYTTQEMETGAEAHALDMYTTYSWETNSIWPTTHELLMGDDFDLSAIPPIELGNLKFDAVDGGAPAGGELNLTLTSGANGGPQYVQDFSVAHHQNNGVFSLDEFLSAGHGY